jgi:methionine-rich copper-binding protein CopC
MKLKAIISAVLLTTGMAESARAVDILVESFETDGNVGTGDGRYTATSEFNDIAGSNGNDHWGRTDDSAGSPVSNVTADYSGFDGTFFWAAEDVNDPQGNGLNPQTIAINGINITGFENLVISGLFGAGNENGLGASNYDSTDYITVEYEIDGGGFNDGLCFNYEPGSGDSNPISNEPIGFDADCDGQSEGPAFRLGTALQEFTFAVPETGTTMNLLISVAMDSGSEEAAFDNIKVTGDVTGVDNPPAVTTTIPTDMAVDVAIDSNVTINFSESVDILTDAIEIDCAISGIQTAPPSPIFGTTAVEANIADFANNEVCTVTVDRLLILDNDGTPDPMDENAVFSFTTVQDFAPEVISTVPADGSVGFVNTDDLVINFSESIDATVDGASMICSVSGKVSFNGLPANDTDVLTLDPVVDLVDGETCNLTIAAAEVTDNDGNPDNMAANVVVSFIVGFPQVEIFEIQGAGLASPYDGLVVATNDNIVTALDTNGFYMQTPDARDDGDAMTSNGIFVFTGGAPTVAVGDQVDLTGEVVEFFDLTEFTNPGSYILNIDSSGNPLPTAVLLDDNFPPTDPTQFPCVDEALGYECVEGMLFDMPQGFISAAYVSFFGANRDDQLVKAGSSRAVREPGIDYPGLVGLPVFDGNPELLEMDVDALGLDLVANSYAAGSEVAITGVFGFDFGEYEIWPSSINVINENVIPGAVRDAATDEVTLASANLFRLFNAIDDPGPEDDDQIADPLEYADRLSKLTRYFVDDMKAPTIIALQEIENISVLQDLTAAIANYGGPTYVSTMVEGNDQGGIDVAYLYQAGLLSNVQITQLGADEINSFDGSLLHDRPPLRLSADVNLSQSSLAINVLVVHMRSRGGIDDAVDGERVRSKRLQQANSVASMVDAILTEAPNVGLYVLGDFNAFQFTDGYVDVVGQITGEAVEADNLVWEAPLFAANPLTQAVQTLTADQQYSFIFRGSAQVLDNAIMNDKGLMNLVDMQYVRGQSDSSLAPELDGSTSLRSTDHDGFVLFIYEDNDLIFENGFE